LKVFFFCSFIASADGSLTDSQSLTWENHLGLPVLDFRVSVDDMDVREVSIPLMLGSYS
jgi:hypothetical protein